MYEMVGLGSDDGRWWKWKKKDGVVVENLMEEIEMRKKEMKKTIAANSTQER